MIKSGWISWSGTDVTNSLDFKNLEELFGQDSEAKPKTPGKCVCACVRACDYWNCVISTLACTCMCVYVPIL